MKITKCNGNGQSICKRCKELNGYGSHWDCFLYEIEGMEEKYCQKCVKEIKEQNKDELS